MKNSNNIIKILIILLISTLGMTACNSSTTVAFPNHQGQLATEGIALPTAVETDSPPSDDPQPSDPTNTPTEEIVYDYVWEDYPGPTVTSYLAVPPPVGIYEQPDNQINFLLLGSDQRPNDPGFRTDVNILVTINKDTKEVNMVSIPRDLYVYIPGYGLDRINTAFVRGGEDILKMTIEYNFGVEVDNYMLINFNGFKELVDILGGIDVYAAINMTDKHPTLGKNYTVYAGLNHMDGETALFYVRARTNSSDFDRARRQQEVLKALADRILRFDVLTLIPDLHTQLKDTIRTDLSIENIISYATLIPGFAQSDDLSMYKIGAEQTTAWINPVNGASVLLPIDDVIQEIIKQNINFGE